ncbi:hypothetical protein D3C80_1805310 [compost metagenome]
MEISRISTSIIEGKGTPCRVSIMDSASSVGISPGWKEIKEMYRAGAISAIKEAAKRSSRIMEPGSQRS